MRRLWPVASTPKRIEVVGGPLIAALKGAPAQRPKKIGKHAANTSTPIEAEARAMVGLSGMRVTQCFLRAALWVASLLRA